MQIDFAIVLVHSIVTGALLFSLIVADAVFAKPPQLIEGLSLITVIAANILIFSAIVFSIQGAVGGLIVCAIAKMLSNALNSFYKG